MVSQLPKYFLRIFSLGAKFQSHVVVSDGRTWQKKNLIVFPVPDDPFHVFNSLAMNLSAISISWRAAGSRVKLLLFCLSSSLYEFLPFYFLSKILKTVSRISSRSRICLINYATIQPRYPRSQSPQDIRTLYCCVIVKFSLFNEKKKTIRNRDEWKKNR